MDENPTFDSTKVNEWMRLAGVATLAMLALFLLVGTVYALKSYRYIGSGVTATNTISVSGEGEVLAVPDMATFSVSVQERAKEVAKAQTTATEKSNEIIAYLRAEGIEDKDIQTAEYSVYPQYEYSTAACSADGYCPPGKQTLVGYEVSQTISVKVRDTDKAGDLLSGVGARGASTVSGLSFTIDDEDGLKNAARDKAIAQANDKAKDLARSLGVDLVRVVGFNESAEYPMYAYGRGGAAYDMAANQSMKLEAAPAPELPVGQNKIMSNVTVTWEIR